MGNYHDIVAYEDISNISLNDLNGNNGIISVLKTNSKLLVKPYNYLFNQLNDYFTINKFNRTFEGIIPDLIVSDYVTFAGIDIALYHNIPLIVNKPGIKFDHINSHFIQIINHLDIQNI